jgi:hypothetical protein
MGTDKLSFERDRGGSDHCAVLTRRGPVRKSRDFSTLLFFPYFPVLFFPVLFFRTFSNYFFSYFFSPVLFQIIFSRTFFSRTFFFRTFSPYFFFPVLFFTVLFSRTFSNVATFEIQRFKISVSCFSRTCRYSTVHVPCRISIQTSPVGLPLDGWGASMRDLKGPKMILFNLKED